MFFKKLIVRPAIQEFCRVMKENYRDWRQSEYHFINTRIGVSLWTANGIRCIKIDGQDESMYNFSERKYIFESIQETINLQMMDKDFDITK